MNFLKKLIEKFKTDKWFELGGVILILLILTAIFYPKVFFAGNIISSSDFLLIWDPWKNLITQPYAAKNYVISDLIEASYPLATYILNAIKDGEIPLWYNLSGMGSASGATFLSTFLTNPVVLILSVINNFNIGYGLSTAVIFFSLFRGFFTYLLLREFGLKKFSSLLGTIIYTFCLYNVIWGLDALSHVSSVIPFCLWAVEKVFKNPSKLNIILFAASIAFLILGGFPSTVFYSALLICLYILSKSVYRFFKKSEKSSTLLKRLGIFFVSGIAGVALTAFTLVPTADMLLNKFDISYRGATHSEVFFDKIYLTRYLVPGILGNPTLYNYQQPPFQPTHSTNFSESAGYIGVITLILASFAFLHIKKDKKPIFFATLSLLAILISFKIGPFLDIVRYLPVFSSNPSTRLILIPSFGMSILAAYGTNILLVENDKKKLIQNFVLSLLIALNTTALLFIYLSKFTDGFVLADKRIFFEVSKYILLVVNGFILIYLLINKTFKELLIKIVILVLIFLDLFFIGKGYLPQIEKDKYYPKDGSIEFLEKQSESSHFRILGFDEIFLSATPVVYSLNSITQMTHYDERWVNFTNLIQPNSLDLARKTMRFRKYKTDLASQLVDLANIRYVLDYGTERTLHERPFAEVKDFNKSVDLSGTGSVEQTFTAPENTDITTIKVRIKDLQKYDFTPLVLEIVDGNGPVLDRYEIAKPVAGENVVEDVDKEVDIKSSGSYTLRITWGNDTTNTASFFAASPLVLYKEGELKVNGNPEVGDLTFAIEHEDKAVKDKYNLIYDDEIKIYENTETFNRVFLVHEFVAAENEDESFEELKKLSSEKNLDKVAIIENFSELPLEDCSNTANDKAEIVSYMANTVTVNTSSECDSILVFSDLYDKDWKVYVDDVKSELLLTDYLMRGVRLPSGKHTVEFKYESRPSTIGAYTSLVSLFALSIFGIVKIKKKSKKI